MSARLNQKETARIRLYTINQCGYYSRGKNEPEFGDIGSILQDLRSWIESKNLNQTCTHDYNEESGTYPTYCYSIKSNSFGDYLVTTWNGTSSSSDTMASIAGNEPVEKASVNLTGIPENHIPGFATYFWIIPELNKLATIRFSTSNKRYGLKEFKRYLHSYMAKCSQFCVRTTPKPHSSETLEKMDEAKTVTIDVAGFSNGSSDEARQLFPRFETILHEKGSKNLEIIRENRENIIRVIRKTELSRDLDYQADIFEKMCDLIGLKKIEEERRTFKFKYGINLTDPSEEELEEIISNWKTNSDAESAWEDLGFELRGDSNIKWLNSFFSSEEVTLEVVRDNDELVDLDALNEEIGNNRMAILQKLDSSHSASSIQQVEKV